MKQLAVALGVTGLVILTSACATRAGIPQPFPAPSAAGSASAGPRSAEPGVRVALVETALQFRGTPYRNGGSDPTGFDCSGFTQYVFARNGITLPRETRDQFKIGTSIDLRNVLPGDLVFFTTTAPGASHVGIAIDAGRFVHAPSSSGVVRIERVAMSYWSRRFVGARRVTRP